jgi:hypothetical protein
MRSAMYASYTEALTGISSIRAYGEQASQLDLLIRIVSFSTRIDSSPLQTAGWTWRTALTT